MQEQRPFVTVIMPALNEEKNITPALDDTLSAFREFDLNAEIIVINDGSTDSTPLFVRRKIEKFPDKVRMINHATPKGVGASFWDGVDTARGDIVCMLPGDNENYPREILYYLTLLDSVDVVIPFVFNKRVRSKKRNLLSYLYRLIINNTFLTSISYTNGTALYRRSLLKELNMRSSGFFFQTDILIRLVKKGYLFAEVPYMLRERREGKSKAVTLRSLKEVVRGYFRLIRDIYFCKKTTRTYAPDSVSAKKHKC